ncbi:hypothetical protein RHMOL_Rhmol01G0370800 [Rhododendron molle]|uniref:Uncharacterized protein n=1 Tax=Rhododendron molle TaxID=49168 RepID=A0ACC0QBQ1_RHOML|nr:hypothetical protein RHMOL_Rhmol01G0370800 [Rhododendron molle]
MVLCSGVRSTLRTVESCIRRLGSHLDNEQLSIVGCRDEIRVIGCKIRRPEGAQYGAAHVHHTNPKSNFFVCWRRIQAVCRFW